VLNRERRSSIWDVCWLPDGTSVVYSHINTIRPGIYRVEIATRRVQPIAGSEQIQYPKCSPSGDILGFNKPPEGWSEMSFSLLRAGTREWVPLGPWAAGYQSWSRDGLSVFALNESRHRIERLTVATRRIDVVAELGDVPLVRRGSAQWMGLAHDGSPLVTFDRSARDLYAFDWEAP
jgi:hypothetical protein